MSVKTVHLPVFTPNRWEEGMTVNVSAGSLWSATSDVSYTSNLSAISVPVVGGTVRGVANGMTTLTFGASVVLEIQE